MNNNNGIDDVRLMNQNRTRLSSLALQQQMKESNALEAEHLTKQLERYSDESINTIKNERLVADLSTFGSVVKINAFKQVIESLNIDEENKIILFDDMLSELNNTKTDNYIYMRVPDTKGLLFFEVFPRLENKSLKIKF